MGVPLHVRLGNADQQCQLVGLELHRGAGDVGGDVQRRVVLEVGRDEVFPHQPGDVDAQLAEQADLDHRADLAGFGAGAEVDVLTLFLRLVQVDVDAVRARRNQVALFEVLEFDRSATFVQELLVEFHGMGSGR
ncbi:hypothetical protein D9M71_675880 [compost metagenome]